LIPVAGLVAAACGIPLNVFALGIQPPGPQRAQHAATEHSTDQFEAIAARRRLRENTSGTIKHVAHDVGLLRI
jgi:hypothetical protein